MDEAKSISRRAGRGLLMLGILQLMLAPMACMPAMILNNTGNSFAEAESPIYLVMAGFFGLIGALLTVSGIFVRRHRLWAGIVGIVVVSIQLFVSMLLVAIGLSSGDLRIVSAGVVLAIASLLLIINLGRALAETSKIIGA
jgi:hypothetical protein